MNTTTEDNRPGRRMATRGIVVALIVCALAGLFMLMVVKKTLNDIEALDLAWIKGGLKLFSASDGPFIVTHLYTPGDPTRDRAVAQLPQPITIIDSRGHAFSDEEISIMTWISRSGETSAPPQRGDVIRAFYWMPKETDNSKNWK